MIKYGSWEYYFEDHKKGDENCDWCFDDYYPIRCKCGGLIHWQIINSYDQNMRGWTDYLTRCDKCGKETELY